MFRFFSAETAFETIRFANEDENIKERLIKKHSFALARLHDEINELAKKIQTEGDKNSSLKVELAKKKEQIEEVVSSYRDEYGKKLQESRSFGYGACTNY